MSRNTNPTPQYLDGSGNPVINGKLYFFKSGTNTPLTTYKDSAEKTPNTHPVLLDSAGRQPNTFFTGTAKQVLTADIPELGQVGVQIWERDPVGGDSVVGDFSVWLDSVAYDKNSIVEGSDSEFYISLESGNENNDPTTSPEQWSKIRFIGVYNEFQNYEQGFVVQTDDGSLWKSETSNNLNNNPNTDGGLNWTPAINLNKSSTTATLIASELTVSTGDIITTNGFYSAGDGGGGQWQATGSTITASQTPILTGNATCSNANGDEFKLVPTTGSLVSEIDIRQVGAKVDADTGGTDDTAAFNAAIASGMRVFVPNGNVRLNSELLLRSGVEIYGVRGASQLWQYGQYLFKQDTPDLENVHIHDLLLDFRSASASRYDCAFSLGAYRKCTIENINFVRYDDQTIIEREPSSSATFNGIDNVHRNWNVSACANLDIAIGLEGYYFKFTGNSATTIINTNIVWPEQFNSSVMVVKENSNRIFSQLELTTDYTVSYDGSNNLTITMIAAPAADERIHIWPSQARSDGNRRPYSNNLWENINCDYIFVRGHVAVRWVDAEDYVYERMTAAANFVKLYEFNPFNDRNGQGGDYMGWIGCVLTYQDSLVTNASSLTGIDLGPGSIFNTGLGVRGDLLWRHSGVNRLIQYRDGEEVTLTGTVTTDGSAVVVGAGTLFRDELTLIGAVPDVVIIDGVKRGIVSIDSDTQLTLSTNAPAQAGIPIKRFNFQNTISYDVSFSASGEPQAAANSKSMGRYYKNSDQKEIGSATILNGNTFVEVSFKLSRAPRVGEISINNFDGINGRTIQISNITASTFRININSAAVADYEFGWAIELTEIN